MLPFSVLKQYFLYFWLQKSITAVVNFWRYFVDWCFLHEELIKLLNPYCLVITTFTNPVMTQQSTILMAVFAGTHMC